VIVVDHIVLFILGWTELQLAEREALTTQKPQHKKKRYICTKRKKGTSPRSKMSFADAAKSNQRVDNLVTKPCHCQSGQCYSKFVPHQCRVDAHNFIKRFYALPKLCQDNFDMALAMLKHCVGNVATVWLFVFLQIPY
jgi:hypothetical protein